MSEVNYILIFSIYLKILYSQSNSDSQISLSGVLIIFIEEIHCRTFSENLRACPKEEKLLLLLSCHGNPEYTGEGNRHPALTLHVHCQNLKGSSSIIVRSSEPSEMLVLS